MPGTPLKQLKPEDPDAPRDLRYHDNREPPLPEPGEETPLEGGPLLQGENIPPLGFHDNVHLETIQTTLQRFHDDDNDEGTPLLPLGDARRLRGNAPRHYGNRLTEM